MRFKEPEHCWKLSELGDFDLAVLLAAKRSKVIQKIQTVGPSLLAPEIVNGEPHDYKADIWALGQVANQILTRSSVRASYPLLNIQDA